LLQLELEGYYPFAMAFATDFSNLRIAREGPLPGYTGHIPGVKANVMGHSYSDSCKRGVAITNALRNNEFPKAIHLVIISNKTLLQVDAIIAIITCNGLLVLVVFISLLAHSTSTAKVSRPKTHWSSFLA